MGGAAGKHLLLFIFFLWLKLKCRWRVDIMRRWTHAEYTLLCQKFMSTVVSHTGSAAVMDVSALLQPFLSNLSERELRQILNRYPMLYTRLSLDVRDRLGEAGVPIFVCAKTYAAISPELRLHSGRAQSWAESAVGIHPIALVSVPSKLIELNPEWASTTLARKTLRAGLTLADLDAKRVSDIWAHAITSNVWTGLVAACAMHYNADSGLDRGTIFGADYGKVEALLVRCGL